MQQITRIEIQKRNPKRRSIYLDGEYAFGLDVEHVIRFNLHENDNIDTEVIETLLMAEEKKSAKEQALRLLAYRARSEKEMGDRLQKKGYDSDISAWVVAELKRLNFLSDQQFSLAFVRDKMRTKPMGPYLIRLELKKKGVTDSFIQAAIEEAYREKSPLEIATALGRKKFSQQPTLPLIKRKQRTGDLLTRRGFSWDIIRDVLEQLESEDAN
ncbi:RecX family transcriptional regulator [bacterium]|nr:RecX family transcriptional regulator [bacterium]